MHIEKSAIKIIVDEIIAENPTICRMADNLAVLDTDVTVLKGDVTVLKGDVADVKLQGRTNTQAINQLFLEQRRQGVMMEEMRSDVKKMLESDFK